MKRDLLLCAALAAVACTAQAADMAFTGSASLVGLTYRLVDLDPQDGVTPWIRFDGSTYVGAGSSTVTPDAWGGTQIQTDAHTVPGDIFSASPVTYQSPDGGLKLAYGPDGASATMNVSGASVGAQGGIGRFDPSTSMAYSSLAGLAGSLYGTQWLADYKAFLPNSGETMFTLSAHTMLIVEGQSQAQAQIDLSKVPQGPLLDGIQAGQYTVTALAQLTAGVIITDENMAALASGLSTVIVGQDLDASGSKASDFAPASDELPLTPFSLSFTNSGDEEKSAGMVIGAGVLANIVFNATPAPNIPEPGTAWLMGLGLTALAGAARSRRRC